ncbi:MAG TPA: cation:proton antiporter [Bdellovibrionales bacterium]|nr:cation:proton antiporter [Bdellovibrionales bacterium]
MFETKSLWPLIGDELQRNTTLPLTQLLLQILVILIVGKLCGLIAKRIGQPQVIGEMVAGILIGKSVLALIAPETFESLFPETSLPALSALSQIGLIIFMFIVGLELDWNKLKDKAASALLVSPVSILFPFLLGSLSAFVLFDDYAPPGVPFHSFSLFMGIAMSITALPVLARILRERQMTQTPLGTLALTCAAIDDVTAWCMLALVIGITKSASAANAIGVVGLSMIYIAAMLKVVRPIVRRTLEKHGNGALNHDQIMMIFLVVLGSAVLTEIIGIHALFGAFVAGTIMPRDTRFRTDLEHRLDVVSVVLLPLFFAFTGIRTQIGLLNDFSSWAVLIVIVALAVIGKLVGSALAARLSGNSWRDSWALGVLMNTRGLMELVVLNIGYDLGILSAKMFTILVVMALVTTIMTGPLLTKITRHS